MPFARAVVAFPSLPFALLCAVSCALLSGCGKSHVRPLHADPGFDRAALRQGLVLEVDTAARVTGFRKSFDAVFGSGDSLAAYIATRIRDSLNVGKPSIPARLVVDSSGNPPPYLLRVRNIVVGGATRELPTALLPGYGENAMSPAGGGTSESCVVAFDVEILESATGASRLSFSVTGSANVPLYAYKTALREAVDAAVRRTAWYLRGVE